LKDPYDVEKAFKGSTTVPATDEDPLDLDANLDESFEVINANIGRPR